VHLAGASRFGTQLVTPNGADEDLLFIPLSCAGFGWNSLTFNGNFSNNTLGSCIKMEPTGAGDGDSNLAGREKAAGYPDSLNSYRWINAWDFITTGAAEHGIHNAGYGFSVRLSQFETTYNQQHGLWAAGTDCEYASFTAEKNGKAGVWASTGAQKFSNVKCHWNNRRRSTHGERWSGFHVIGASGAVVRSIQATNIECQSNYGDGAYIKAKDSAFSLVADVNGYIALGSEGTSDTVSAHFVFDSCTNTAVIAHGRDSSDATGPYITQWTHRIIGTCVFSTFNVSSDGRVNAVAADDRLSFQSSTVGGVNFFKQSAEGKVFADLNVLPDATKDGIFRLFRNSSITGVGALEIYSPSTSTVRHRLLATAGNSQHHADNDGDVIIGNGTTGGSYNTSKLRLGATRIWIDAAGTLRSYGASVSADTDGSAYHRQISVTSPNLGSLAATINTVGKFAGKMVWNSTVGRPVWASGSAASAVWVYADGTTANTPV
jgi:hypothetical protein